MRIRFKENYNTNHYLLVVLILKHIYASVISTFFPALWLILNFPRIIFQHAFSLLHVLGIFPITNKGCRHRSTFKATLVRAWVHPCYFSLSQNQPNAVTSFSLNRSKYNAVLWVPLCARRVSQNPCMCCFIISHSLLACFCTLDQHGKWLERSPEVIFTPDDLPRGT